MAEISAVCRMTANTGQWFALLMRHAKTAIRAEGKDFLLTKIRHNNDLTADSRPVVKDEDYITIRIRSSRIVDVRRWTTPYHGSIHSNVTYLHEDHGLVEFNKVLVPEKLRQLDPKNIDQVIQVDKSIFAPIPYRGGLSLEIGLFSVKGSDLAVPYLDLLSTLAEKAGVSAVNTALSYAEPLRRGMELLLGNKDHSALEIGIDIDLTNLEPGNWLAMRCEKGSVDVDDMMIDREDATLVHRDGTPFRRFPYIIFSIEASRIRDDWMTLPDIKTAWNMIGKAVRLGQMNDAEQLMRQFVLLTRASSDLVPEDAKRLVDKAQKRFAVMRSEMVMTQTFETELDISEFANIDLYDHLRIQA